MIERIIIHGLVAGGVYALLAVGFSLIFGVARIVNLAHTAFYMLAAYLIFAFVTSFGLPVALSIIISIAAVTIVGVISYKLVISPIRGHETTVLIVTVALAMVIQETLIVGYGGGFQAAPSLVSGYTKILGTKVLYQQILTLAVVVVMLLCTWALLMKTRLGIAIRSAAQDREVANLMGMDVAKTGMITMAIAVVLAAIAGAMVAPLRLMGPYMWQHPLVMILAVVVLGGLGSIRGSLMGAFILGFAETIVVVVAPTGAYLKGAVALSIMLIVILIRPEGLFGVSFEEER